MIFKIYKINQSQITCKVWLVKFYWKSDTSDTITTSKFVSKIYTLRQVRIMAQTWSHRLETSIIEAAQEHKAIEAAVQAA